MSEYLFITRNRLKTRVVLITIIIIVCDQLNDKMAGNTDHERCE